ncbi:MAG: mreD [Chlamydiia bacterium]|nr:mreD [Chlamydiia bacterium]
MRVNRAAFFLSLFLFFLSPIYFPRLKLLFFAPYLILVMYKMDFFSLLVRASFAGIIMDLFSAHSFFGLSSLLHLFTAMIVYTMRLNFFEDKLTTLPIMTFIFSVLFSLLELFFYPLLGGSISINFRWILSDLFCMPFADAILALFVFSLPFQLTKALSKMFRTRRCRR